MYDDLVARLWECASGECFNCSQYTETTNASVCSKELMKQAADAIDELSKLNCELLFRVGQAEALIDYYQTGRKTSNEPPKEEI